VVSEVVFGLFYVNAPDEHDRGEQAPEDGEAWAHEHVHFLLIIKLISRICP
jgi:hypothetical protein